ncbi:MAG TPA: hypothetical protein VJ975_10750 [Candidatus Limnocylindria bacterium]|nr:hypothetical protein [Candidatus Limnocylindria bacterium]
MADQPVHEPISPEPERDRTEPADENAESSAPPIRPSKAEGSEEDAGPRPPRPSQAEGERDGRSEEGG